jgi:hypothetical protein
MVLQHLQLFKCPSQSCLSHDSLYLEVGETQMMNFLCMFLYTQAQRNKSSFTSATFLQSNLQIHFKRKRSRQRVHMIKPLYSSVRGMRVLIIWWDPNAGETGRAKIIFNEQIQCISHHQCSKSFPRDLCMWFTLADLFARA